MRRAFIAWSWPTAGTTIQIVASFAAAATVGAVCTLLPLTAPGWIVLLTCAGLVGGALARWTVEAESSSRVVLRALFGGGLLAFILGGCVLPFTLWISTAMGLGFTDLAAAWVWIALLSAIIGGPLGASIALFYTPLLIVAGKAHRAPSHAGGEHVGRFAAVWLGAAAALHAALVHAIGKSGAETPAQAVVWTLVWVVPAALALAAATTGVASRVARRRWLARVRRGEIPGYRVEPLPAEGVRVQALLPLEHGKGPCDELIVRIAEDAPEAGYREAAAVVEDEPVALLRRA